MKRRWHRHITAGGGSARPIVVGRLAWRAGPLGKRLVVLLMLFYGFMFLLAAAMYRIQILERADLVSRMERQSIRRVRLPAIRGKIYDRYGTCLVDNRPSYDLVLYPEEMRFQDRDLGPVSNCYAQVQLMAGLLDREVAVTPEDIKRHLMRERPLPLGLWEDLSPEDVARLMEQMVVLQGIDIVPRPVRSYPYGALAGHFLGYLGRTGYLHEDQLGEFHFFLPDTIGKAGVEAAFDQELRGWAGVQLLQVDVLGYRHSVLTERSRPAIRGKDLYLTIDTGLQQVLEESLDGRRGAAVALNPNNGEVWAMVSSPGLDPRDFTPRLTQARMQELLNDPDHPFQNRAIYTVYPPGSTFKPVVALAALENGVVDASTHVFCSGSFYVGQRQFRCASRYGHGSLDLVHALEASCNVYFYEKGIQLGLDPIREMASQFHLGRAFGIPIQGESSGLLPSDAWKRDRFNDAWRPGDTANLSIGQGYLNVTVLSMASVASTIANGGQIWMPRIALGFRDPKSADWASIDPRLLGHLQVKKEHLDLVRQGMHLAVSGSHGTARRAEVRGVEMAGKTGTAEYFEDGQKKNHAWFIGFAPMERPQIALAVVVEDATGGGRDAAPVAGQAFSYWFGAETVMAWDGFGDTGEGD
jgi:penicillin-binding protein 2